MRSTRPAPTSRVRRASAWIPSSGSGRASTSSCIKASRQTIDHYNFYSLVHRPHDHLRLLRVHRGRAAGLQRRHDRQPRLHRRDPLRHEVHDPGRRHGRRAIVPGICGPLQVQHHPEASSSSATAGSCAWSGCPRSSRRSFSERLLKRGKEVGVPDLIDRIADETVGNHRGGDHALPEGKGSPGAEDGDSMVWVNLRTRRERRTTMGLTGIQIFKLLPKTNCGECGVPTCLAFAMNLASGKGRARLLPLCVGRGQGEALRGLGPPDPAGGHRRRGAGPSRSAARRSCSGTRRPSSTRPALRRWSNPTSDGAALDRKLKTGTPSSMSGWGLNLQAGTGGVEGRATATPTPLPRRPRRSRRERVQPRSDDREGGCDEGRLWRSAPSRSPLLYAATARTLDELWAALAKEKGLPLAVKADDRCKTDSPDARS